MEWLTSNVSSPSRGAEKEPRLWRHLIVLIIIVTAVTAIYANVTRAYFCAYDDFDNLHQTVFEDAYQPLHILTTSHFGSYKYRPLHRLINLFTNFLADGDPTVFRIRNLGFHLVNAMLVYALGWQLFGSARISGAAALLFGVHPLANQTVIAAIWTLTAAHTGFLLALVMFVASTRAKRFWSLWLTGALLSASLSLFTYDSAIVVFGLILIYWLLFVVGRGQAVRVPYVAVFVTVSSAFLGLYFMLRRLFVPRGWEQVTAGLPLLEIVGKNTVMYLSALLNPVDLVLANELLDTPLPSEIHVPAATLITIGIVAVLIVTSIGVYAIRWLRHQSSVSQQIDWAAALFLISGMAAPLLPVLVFSSRPSETYLYLSVAFYALLLVYLLGNLFGETRKSTVYGFYVPVVFLLGIFSAATSVRNQRVSECGQTVHRILYGLPDKLLRNSSWTVVFANVPGEKDTRHYGFYGFRGIDTIAGGRSTESAITHALQLAYGNLSLSGKIVQAKELSAICSAKSAARTIGAFVHWDGRMETCLP